MDRIVLHFDMDCFYCQVETKRLGLSVDTPLVVHSWGMLMSVNYAAKALGITRKTHAKEAAAKGAVAVHMRTIDIDSGECFDEFDYENSDRNRYKSSVERYREASEQVMTAMKGALPASSRFERASIDECFADVSSDDLLELFPDLLDVSKLHWENGSFDLKLDGILARGGLLGERIRAEVLHLSSYTASCGVSVTRQVAKLCCALNKPDKLTIVSSDRTTEFMRNVPIKEIRGLGPRAFETLQARVPYVNWSSTMCGDLWSEENIGTDDFGTWFFQALRGLDGGNQVEDSLLASSVQSSKQFRPNLPFAQLIELLRALTADMVVRLSGRPAKTLVVSLSTPSGSASRQTNFPKTDLDECVLSLAKKTGYFDPKHVFSRIAVGAKDVVSTAANEEVGAYLAASRLHFMGTWRARYLEYMSVVEDTGDWGFSLSPHTMELATDTTSTDNVDTLPVYLLVDMDCFFVSVAVHLAGLDSSLPAAVASGLGATSEICSANYPARKFGVKASSFVSTAQSLCPELHVFRVTPELLRCCETVWKKVLRILALAVNNDLARVTGKSCDEALISLHSSDSNAQLARIIQSAVLAETGVPCSVGVAPSRILAKLATSFAKPAGIKVLSSLAEGCAMLSGEPVSVLPGVGYVTLEKLADAGVNTVQDLLDRANEIPDLLGAGTAKKLLLTAQGVDEEISENAVSHTVSAEKNFGLRNLTTPLAAELVRALAAEATARIPKEARPERAVLRLKIAVPNWTESVKKGGMGHVFDWSRGCKWKLGSTIADLLCPLLAEWLEPDRIRGIGVSVRLRTTVAAGPLDSWFAGERLSKRERSFFQQNENAFPKDAGVTENCCVCNAQVLAGCLTNHFLTHLGSEIQTCACPVCQEQIGLTDSTHVAQHFS